MPTARCWCIFRTSDPLPEATLTACNTPRVGYLKGSRVGYLKGSRVGYHKGSRVGYEPRYWMVKTYIL